MDKDTRKSTFNQLFQPILNESFYEQVVKLEADKYAKKLSTAQLIKLMALAQLEQQRGLRDISNSLNNAEFSQTIALDSISASQLSRRLRDLPVEISQSLFKSVVLQAGKEMGFNCLRQKFGRLYLIDSSTISLCLSRYPWASFRKTKGGIKLHLRLKFHNQGVIPDKAVITPAKPADRTQMDALIVEEQDTINVFDRGYIDYKKFNNYCENSIRFVSRLKSNALVDIVKDLPLNPESKVKKDCIIYLGKDGTTKMKHPLRLIEAEDSEGNPVVIITNDFGLDAEEISDIYRYRWQIELFFKWIKQHLRVKHFYGLSARAVENQLLIALTTYCLLMLLKLKAGYQGPLLTIKRLFHTCFLEPFTIFIQKLYNKRKRSSKGRRRIDHESIYSATVKQVMPGEIEHLDDLTYDPVIL